MKVERNSNYDEVTTDIIERVDSALFDADMGPVRAGCDRDADGGPAIMLTVSGRRFELRLVEHV